MKFVTALTLLVVVLASKKRCSREKMSTLADCADGARPSKSLDGCPTCLPKAFDKKKCSGVKCMKPSTCASGVQPARKPDGCCITCTPAKIPKCTKEQKTACQASIDSLIVCSAADDPKSSFNVDTCCMTCKRPARADANKKCTKDDFKTCMDTAPECGAEEEPLREKGQCCVSCRRPARDSPLREVGKCGNVPQCAANESPVRVKDDTGAFACPTCKPPRPVCSPACTTGQICARSKDAITQSCKAKKRMKLKLKAKVGDAATKAFFASATPDEMKATLQEVVNRYCDKEENAEKCDKYQDTVNDGMELSITSTGADEVQVQVDIPDIAVVDSRRLADDASSLLAGALTDPDATGSITMTDESGSQPANGAQSLSVSSALLAFTAVASVLVL